MDAMKYAERLSCESKWSHATYGYLKAAFIIQFLDDERRNAAIENACSRKSSITMPITSNPKDDVDGGTLAKHAEELLELVLLKMRYTTLHKTVYLQCLLIL